MDSADLYRSVREGDDVIELSDDEEYSSMSSFEEVLFIDRPNKASAEFLSPLTASHGWLVPQAAIFEVRKLQRLHRQQRPPQDHKPIIQNHIDRTWQQRSRGTFRKRN
jgi:hypothetical protein